MAKAVQNNKSAFELQIKVKAGQGDKKRRTKY